jgi:hypothetical protein
MNTFISDIAAETLYADQLGMHSAWIGEHHFNPLAVLSRPDLVLSYIAARTSHIRLAPAVTLTPLHHPIHHRAMGYARSAQVATSTSPPAAATTAVNTRRSMSTWTVIRVSSKKGLR